MTDNLAKTTMTSGQDQKEVSSNDADGELDAAITATLSKVIDNTNGVTLTTLEMQRAVYFTFTDGGTTAACTATFPTVVRGVFGVQNSCGQTLTLTISAQAFTPPTIEDGELAIFISDGVNVKALGTGGGASGSANIVFEDATTSTVPNVQTITRLSTGTPANGIGGTIDLRTEDDGGNTESAAAIVFRLDDVTNTSEVGAMGLGTYDASTFTEILTLKAGKAGIGSLTPLTDFEVRGPVAAGGTLTLSTAETSVVATDELGVINFQAPVDAAGTDAILVAAAIKAISTATFSATVNTTDLAFFTAVSETALEKMRLTSAGRLGVGTTIPSVQLEVQGAVGAPGEMTLSTKETTIVATDELGVINFQAPLETTGTDAILVAAAIKAIATASFSASVNTTDLVFFTAVSETAVEAARLTSGQDFLIQNALGVGNTASATTPGTVTDKMEIFDAAGSSVGFIAIYDAIT